MAKFPKLFSSFSLEDCMPRIISRPRAISALLGWALEPSGANVSILASVVVRLPRSTANACDVRVTASHIEYISFSTAKDPSEIDENVEVNSAISVSLSSHDTFSTKVREMVANRKRVECSALGIGDECASDILEDERCHE